jgi:hypothetical protein
MSKNWKFIMIHHSLGKDDYTRNWDSIRTYHMSWRYNGIIITKEYAQKLIQKGVSGVLRPWQDIGYHLGCEYEGDKYIIQEGRPLTLAGAHCVEGGMNMLSLGFCFVGNFDINPPKTEQLIVGGTKILSVAEEFKMGEPIDYIKYHTEFAPYKSCPGKQFPAKEKFAEFLIELKNGFINYKSAFKF